jgi:hypothetical protein
MDGLYDDTMCTDIEQRRSTEMPNLRVLVSKIREQVILNQLSLSLSVETCVRFFDMAYKTFFSNYCYLPFFYLFFILFFFLFFYLMTMYSLKNLWQLICVGGKVLHELWKIKGTSERQITRYTSGK